MGHAALSETYDATLEIIGNSRAVFVQLALAPTNSFFDGILCRVDRSLLRFSLFRLTGFKNAGFDRCPISFVASRSGRYRKVIFIQPSP
jgi:hypothetical protein